MACAELGQLKDARRAAGLFSSVVLVKGVCVHVLFGVEQAGEACRAAGQFTQGHRAAGSSTCCSWPGWLCWKNRGSMQVYWLDIVMGSLWVCLACLYVYVVLFVVVHTVPCRY